MSDLIIIILLLLLIIIIHTDASTCEQGGITECCTPNVNASVSGRNCHVRDYTNTQYCSCSKTCVNGNDVDSYGVQCCPDVTSITPTCCKSALLLLP